LFALILGILYSSAMHPLLATLDLATDKALKGLSSRETQARRHDHPETWSIQQSIEHLLLTYHVTIQTLAIRLEKGTPTRAVPGLRQRIGQWTMLELGRFPQRRKAPKPVVPTALCSLQNGEELTARVYAELTRMDLLLSACEEKFGSRRAASHMVLGPLSMQQWRKFHLIHGRHHLKQIARIRAEQHC
jgi:hypothetical protein